jgi:hypothetical protein
MASPRKAAKAAVKRVVAPVPEPSNPPAKAVAAARPKATKPKATSPAKAAKPAVKPAKPARPEKPKKPKLVRDSFTIPKAEYGVLEELKLRAAKLGQPARKSEVLRAGVKALAALSDEALLASLAAVPRVKTGRPAKVQ